MDIELSGSSGQIEAIRLEDKSYGRVKSVARLSQSPLICSEVLEHSESSEMAAEKSRIASARWQLATAAVIANTSAAKEIDTLTNTHSSPADKLFAAVRLELLIHKYPGRVLLVEAIRRKRIGVYERFLDRVTDELFITGELIFLWFTPAKFGNHWPIISFSLVIALLITFFFMAGEYGLYQAQYGCHPDLVTRVNQANPSADISQYVHRLGLHHLFDVFSGQAGRKCEGETLDSGFSSGFLVLWGAQWAPAIAEHEAWRWWTMQFCHLDFRHVVANCILLLLLGVQMEQKYGSWRFGFLWSLAVFGGGLLSVAVDDPCKVVAGASGGIFGLVGLYAADLLRNYKTIQRPILQGLAVTGLLIWLAVMAGGNQHGVSNMTHVGGLIWGLVPGMLFLNPGEPQWEMVEAWSTVLGALGFLVLAVCLPVYVYTQKLPGAINQCISSGWQTG